MKKKEERIKKKLAEERRLKEEAARKAQYEAYLQSKREEEAEELTQCSQTMTRVSTMRNALERDPAKFNHSIVEVLDDYQGNIKNLKNKANKRRGGS